MSILEELKTNSHTYSTEDDQLSLDALIDKYKYFTYIIPFFEPGILRVYIKDSSAIDYEDLCTYENLCTIEYENLVTKSMGRRFVDLESFKKNFFPAAQQDIKKLVESGISALDN